MQLSSWDWPKLCIWLISKFKDYLYTKGKCYRSVESSFTQAPTLFQRFRNLQSNLRILSKESLRTQGGSQIRKNDGGKLISGLHLESSGIFRLGQHFPCPIPLFQCAFSEINWTDDLGEEGFEPMNHRDPRIIALLSWCPGLPLLSVTFETLIFKFVVLGRYQCSTSIFHQGHHWHLGQNHFFFLVSGTPPSPVGHLLFTFPSLQDHSTGCPTHVMALQSSSTHVHLLPFLKCFYNTKKHALLLDCIHC